MLFLTILATVIIGFDCIGTLKRGFDLASESDEPGLTFIGVLIGFAISALPIVALWVLYCHL